MSFFCIGGLFSDDVDLVSKIGVLVIIGLPITIFIVVFKGIQNYFQSEVERLLNLKKL